MEELLEEYKQTLNAIIEKYSNCEEMTVNDFVSKYAELKQFSIHGVSNTFKAQIQSDIEEAKRTLKSTKENTAYSFEDASGWVEEMNLIKGEIQGLTKALNYC